MFNKLTLSLSVSVLAIGIMGNGAMALDRVTFQTDWIPSGEHAAYYGAWEKGIYADHGIDITITRGYGSGDTVTKLAARGFDFGIADVGAVLTARAREGVPVKVISTLYTHSPHSLFVLESSGITDFSDLDGKRIGITPGNSHRVYFPHIAAQAGTDASSIRWVNMDGGAMAVQLIAKNIDAAPFYAMHHYFQNKAARSAGEEIIVLPFVDAGFAIYAAGLIASDETIEQRPELVKRFLAATHDAWRWARDNPDEACDLHIKRVPEVQKDDCMGSLSATLEYVFNDHTDEVGVGRTDDERIAATWEAVAEANDLDPSWDPHVAFDTSLLPEE
jgi:NitT/TauT family transport system substrate-binding protein